MGNYKSLLQRMHKKSSLQIICIYRQSSYLGFARDALGKTKEHMKQILSKW